MIIHHNKSVFFALTFSLITLLSCKKDPIANKIPLANAGASTSITLPLDSVRLSGSGKDEDGQVVAYLWSEVSGPSTSIIVNPGSPSTMAKGLVQGNYIFQLMVTDDKGATGVDTMAVQVNPSPIKTISIQPSNNPTEVEIVNFNGQDQSGSGTPDIPVEAWTRGGLPLFIRELLKFDLSGIPSNATIISANLYLYSYPTPTLNGNFTDPNFGTNNSMFLQQVTSNWSGTSVNWFNQPSASSASQITIPNVGQTPQDLNLDVTGMVSSMGSANANYGFLMKLQNEVTYTSRIFVSSFNTTYPNKHPKLVIVYQ